MDYLQQMAAVGFVLLLLGATLWLLRRRGIAVGLAVKRPAGRRLEYLERLPLTPQQALHLVRVGGSTLLLASTPSGCTLLHSLPLRDAAAPPEITQ
jgi:flagellar biosynthetic protein FliO